MTMLIGSTFLSAILVYKIEAFELTKDRRSNIVSEMLILAVSYNFSCFDLIDVEENFEVGYIPIAFTGLYILVSLLMIIVTTIAEVIFRIKVSCAKRRYHKGRQKFKSMLKQTHNERLKNFMEKRQEDFYSDQSINLDSSLEQEEQ